MLNHPERVAAAGLLVYGLLWLIAPVEIVFPVSWSAMGFIALCYAAFFAGIVLAAVMPQKSAFTASAKGISVDRGGFWLFSLLGASGMALRIYDKLFVRGINLADTALESREILADVEAGPLSVVGGALYPFCYIPLIIWLYNKPFVRQSWIKGGVALLLFLLPAMDALLQLSRSQLLVAMSMMYASVACVSFHGNPFNRRVILPVATGLAVVLAISILTFFSRIDQMGLEVLFTIFESAYGYTLSPTPEASVLLQRNDGFSLFLQSLLPILQYYLHGLFEFGLLWTRPDSQTFTLGGQIFAPYAKLLGMLGVIGRDVIDYEAAYFRTGIFTTFFGPVWSDFGWFSPIFMFFFGFVAKLLSRRSSSNDVAAFPIYAFFVVVIFFMPVVNFFVSAQGMYAVNAFLVYWIYEKYLRRIVLPGSSLGQRRVV